ncbi:MAG: M13 family metallopeptidase [Methanobacteriota archaeon]
MQISNRIRSCWPVFFTLLLLIESVAAINPDDMDPFTNPGDDLFQYANGNWMERNPVPADMSWYSAVSEVQQSVNDRVKTIIEEAADNPDGDTYEQTLIGTFYSTALDEERADRVGIQPIRSDLDQIAGISTREGVRNVTTALMKRGMTPFFSFYADEDPGNSTMLIATIEQSGTSLPDREYYFRDDAESERVRDEFKGHVARMFTLINESPEQGDIDAATVLRIETRLANASAPSHGYGKPDRRYFPCPVRRLDEVTDGIDWEGLLTSVNRTDLDSIDLYQPLYVREVGNVLKDESIEDLKVFLTFKALQFAAPYSSLAFEKENFNFYNRVLSGQQEMEPRWKRVINTMDSFMGGAIGKLYILKYFTPEEKAHVREIVENLKKTFRVRLANLTWMDPSTRVNATAMLDAMGIQIGYPDRWGDYSNLNISNRSYLDNILNISAYYYLASLQIAGTPSDTDVWYLSPQSVNAYYDTTRNKIVLPAGVLQPPFYDPSVDDAEHYGAIGAIIGHELIHGFDTPLRKYVVNGTESPLWSANDTARFHEVTAPLVQQFDAMEAYPGQNLNGSRTLSENAADIGGLVIAWNAWQNTRAGNETGNQTSGEGGNTTDELSAQPAASFTDEQRFFIAYSQAWRGTIRDEELRNMVLIEEHPWNKYRVNTIPFNMDEFYAAFPEIGPDNLLYRNESARARIW